MAKEGLRERGLLSRPELKKEADSISYDGNLTGRNPDGTWEVERILALKKQKGTWRSLVRWAGWGAEDDTWEPKSEIPAAFLEEFEDAAAAREKPQKQPRRPFTLELTAHESNELFEFRVADTFLWLADMRADGCAKAGRQQKAVSEVRIYSTKPFSPGAFKALREHFVRAATAADPERNVDAAVTPISSHRGGVRPVDTFAVMDDPLLDECMGAGAFTCEAHNNGAAVKMVAPIDFFLKAKRDPDTGELLPVMELVATAHFVALVPDHENPGAPIFRTDNMFIYPPGDVAAYKRALAAKLFMQPTLPTELYAWAVANANAQA